MTERIYSMDDYGRLTPFEERRFDQEDHLQKLIADHPGLLAGEQIDPESPRRWILISREQGIAETSDTGNTWAVDHLLIDQDAIPTLVEVKRGESRRTRREVVGQMLDYAAHATSTWDVDEIRSKFEQTTQNPDDALSRLLQSNEEADADEFWERVSTNLAAKHIRLLFVADEIPDTLQRVVGFLNEQMPSIEVLAVEVKRFSGETSRQMLVPRVIGRVVPTSSRSRSGRRRVGREELLDQFSEVKERTAVTRLLDAVAESGGTIRWGRVGISLRGRSSHHNRPIAVAWLFPPGRSGWRGLRDLTLGYETREQHSQELKALLDRWCDQFDSDGFSENAGVDWGRAYNVTYSDVTANIDLLCDRLAKVLTDLKAL